MTNFGDVKSARSANQLGREWREREAPSDWRAMLRLWEMSEMPEEREAPEHLLRHLDTLQTHPSPVTHLYWAPVDS
jgi:hypothetical protein